MGRRRTRVRCARGGFPRSWSRESCPHSSATPAAVVALPSTPETVEHGLGQGGLDRLASRRPAHRRQPGGAPPGARPREPDVPHRMLCGAPPDLVFLDAAHEVVAAEALLDRGAEHVAAQHHAEAPDAPRRELAVVTLLQRVEDPLVCKPELRGAYCPV